MPVVTGWTLPDPKETLTRLPDEQLGSEKIDSSPLELPLGANLSFDGGALPVKDAGAASLSVNARGALSVMTFNSSGDEDEDGLLTGTAGDTPEGKLVPPLTFNPAAAWLKYRVSAGIKASGAQPLGRVGFALDASAGVVFADYRAHAREERLRQTVASDILQARLVTALDHVRGLGDHEALAMMVSGALSGSVEIAWSDVFTGQFGALADVLGVAGLIGLKADVGASLKASVSVDDAFLVVFSCVTRGEQWRLGVRKARTSGIAPRFEAGIQVSFADPGQVARLADAMIDAALDKPRAAIEPLLAKTSLDQLSDGQREIARVLMKRLGLDPDTTALTILNSAIDKLRKKALDTVRDAAASKIALSFQYEYNRIDEQVNLLQALLDEAALTRFHAAAVTGRIDVITDALATNTPGLSLETYLNQRTMRRERSWEFTLGIGKWLQAGGSDFSNVRRTRRLNAAGRAQDSYLGTRGYHGTVGHDRFSWGVDFTAGMKNFANGPAPLVGEFEVGLHLAFVDEQAKLSDDELSHWLDLAVLWRVIGETDLERARRELMGLRGKTCTLSAQVTLGADVLRALLPSIAGARPEAFAEAFAAAMPWLEEFPERRSVALRRMVYADLWAAYFAQSSPAHRPTRAEMALVAASRLRKKGLQLLAAFEERQRDAQRPVDPVTFAGLVEINGDSAAACAAFSQSLSMLEDSAVSDAGDAIPRIYRTANALWAQSHHVRAVGAYLLDAAANGSLLPGVRRVLIATPDGGDTIVLTA